jgi:alkaline phosphatase
MKRVIRLSIALLVCLPAGAQIPKNIILIIGDGMGPGHFTAARLTAEGPLRLAEFSTIGLATTRCANDIVTDSAAAASALATGVKVNRLAVSVDPGGQKLETVLEVAERAGKATGIVTTSYFWDGTPAAFAAHVPDRGQSVAIIDQMLRSGVDLIAGAGVDVFGRREGYPPSIEALAANTGFTLIRTAAELETGKGPRFLAVFPSQQKDMDNPDVPLPKLARWAIDRLKGDPEGFFLVIEHEGTDTTSHENSRTELLACLRSFDQAVGVALDFARTAGDTLVVVTGDHETGSLRISSTRLGRLRLEFATVDHTGVAVPVLAFGPGASSFGGFLDNTDIGKKLISFSGGK